jgi:hypothetical protein
MIKRNLIFKRVFKVIGFLLITAMSLSFNIADVDAAVTTGLINFNSGSGMISNINGLKFSENDFSYDTSLLKDGVGNSVLVCDDEGDSLLGTIEGESGEFFVLNSLYAGFLSGDVGNVTFTGYNNEAVLWTNDINIPSAGTYVKITFNSSVPINRLTISSDNYYVFIDDLDVTGTVEKPGAPIIGTATAGDAQASVSFTPPTSDGGTSITGYTVTSSPGGFTGTGATSPITVTGLTNGTAYTFTVTATNSEGTGSPSAASNIVTPKYSQTISFTNPGVQNFGTSPTLTATASSGLPVTFTSSTPSVCTVTSGGVLTFLKSGTATINADQAGDGSYMAAPTVTQTFTVNAVLPGAPTIETVAAGDTIATVSFTPPASDGGTSITGYTVTSSPGGFTGTGAASPITVTGLTNGTTYTFTVTATNSVGTGLPSAASNSVTPLSSQTITFSNPGTQNFGTSPTLTATASSGLPVTFTSSTPGVCTVTSGGVLTFLKSGTATINADQAGDGSYMPAPTVTQSFTVNAVWPGAPTTVTAAAGDTQATVSFSPPTSDGGASITSYMVMSNPEGLIGIGAASPITVTGLTNGTTYTFTVTATNSVGTGLPSAASNSVTPLSSQTITFSNPGTQNFGTSPTLTATASSGLPVTYTSSTPDVCTVTSGGVLTFLKSGTATIHADQAGDGIYMPAPTVTRSFTVSAVLPGAPTIGTVAAGDKLATVSFIPPTSNGGASITGYTVTSSPGGFTATGSGSPITVTGLTNGTAYTFTVTATNTVGTGLPSLFSAAVTPALSSYNISFNANGGVVSTTSLTVTNGNSIILPTPTYYQNNFNGWYTSPIGGSKVGDAGTSYVPSSDIILYAQWTPMRIPSVTTYNPYSVLTTSAELGGNVTSDGGDTIIDRGIVYSSVDSTPIIGEAGVSQISNGTGTGEFNVSLSLLTEDTTYYAQAYTINSVGTAYGGVISFTTLYDATQDNLDIAEVKAAIEGTTFSATQAAAGTSEMALSKAQSLVNMLNLRGCTAIVEAETYNAAIAGTSVDKDGTDGYCTFTVKISKGRGTLQVSNIKTMTIIAETYKNDNYTGGGSAANSTNSSVIVNGKVVSAGTIANTKVDGKKISTISIDEQRLEQMLAEEKINPVITIPVSTEADVIIAELNGRMIRNMENKKATIEVKTDVASYVLPAMQINIESISKQINKNVELKDILVRIEISKPTNEEAKLVENSSVRGGFTIVTPAVEFNITCTHGDKTIKLDKFSSFVERTIAIPEGVNPSKITTGIIINNDGTFRHVPTKIVVIDGRYYAKINSLTNSLYSVIWNPIEFTDVSNHWSKEAVNDMGSRMIINGVGDKMYEPDRYITRAEFAAIAVKSLGLKPGTGENKFDDIKSTDWYCPYIETASEYGIISGFGNGNFRPNDKITREQAMTMIARAMKITGLEYELNSYDTELTFSEFEDSAEFSEWAVESMVKCVKTGIVTGKGANTIAPKDQITRAEVAVIIQRLLKASNLI